MSIWKDAMKRSLEPRMLTQGQAAEYCGIGVKSFKTVCPVRPTALRDGLARYDRFKLDRWLDGLSGETPAPEPDVWLDRLGASLSDPR